MAGRWVWPLALAGRTVGKNATDPAASSASPAAFKYRFCLRKVGSFAAAAADYGRLIDGGKATPRNYNSRAYCHASLGRYAEAVADYGEAINVGGLGWLVGWLWGQWGGQLLQLAWVAVLGGKHLLRLSLMPPPLALPPARWPPRPAWQAQPMGTRPSLHVVAARPCQHARLLQPRHQPRQARRPRRRHRRLLRLPAPGSRQQRSAWMVVAGGINLETATCATNCLLDSLTLPALPLIILTAGILQSCCGPRRDWAV